MATPLQFRVQVKGKGIKVCSRSIGEAEEEEVKTITMGAHVIARGIPLTATPTVVIALSPIGGCVRKLKEARAIVGAGLVSNILGQAQI